MRREFVDVLACPHCRATLSLTVTAVDGEEVMEGELACAACDVRFAVERGVPRFVPQDNYAQSFGYQWNSFRKTQLDSHCGITVSRDRFLTETQWRPEDLQGKLVLDIGCGAGRFSEVALSLGARLVSLDYSSAVDAAFQNLAPNPRLTIVQGSVYSLPVKPGAFDYVYCLGVLQHTPDPRAAVLALAEPLRPGGKAALDFYPALALNILWPKYWLRPFTKRMNHRQLFELVRRWVRPMLRLSNALAGVPFLGRRLKYAVPVMNYRGSLPLTDEQHVEWSTLDTFDMFAPAHDHPQTASTVRSWLAAAGFRSCEAAREGLVVGRAVR